MEEAALRFQNLLGPGPSEGSEIGGNNTAFGSVTSLEGFHHAAKVFAQSCSLAGRNRKSAGGMNGIESLKTGARGCASKYAAGSGGMKAVAIVPGRYRFGDFAFHFDAEVICQ